MSDTRVKQPAESRLFSMDFTADLSPAEVLVTASCTAAPTGLTLTGPASVNSKVAQQRIAGGTAGTRYKVTFVVTTSLGNTLEAEGYLLVKDL